MTRLSFKIINETFLLLSIFILYSCSSNSIATTEDTETTALSVTAYITKGDKTASLQKLPDLIASSSVSGILIAVDKAKTYQPIEGFGASLTESSAYVLKTYLSQSKRTEVLKELFSSEGANIGYLRLTMGSSDFSFGNYSYDDVDGDINLTHFSLDRDFQYIIPVLKEIISIKPDLKIMASPWSPPAWMKTSNNMVGGSLNPEYYNVYAQYFVKYINTMKENGIPIEAITIQNEPLYASAAYPCMLMTSDQQKDFIKNHLGPLFATENIKTKIMLYDHNLDHPEYGSEILSDSAASQYVSGTAFHAYAGEISAMGQLKSQFPDKAIYFTEQSGGEWAPNYSDNIKWNTEELIINGTKNWTQNVLLWNLALDENYGPTNKGCLNCRGVITVKTNSEVMKNEEFYVLAHPGKFLQNGAKRCFSTETEDKGIKNVSFVNPDGSIVLLVSNFSGKIQKITLKSKNQFYNTSIPNNSIITFYWY